MATKTKTSNVPDIGGLLNRISEKREELPKTERQVVQPVSTEKQENVKTLKQENENTFNRENVKTNKRINDKTQKPENKKNGGVGGRPSLKRDDVEYVRIGANIPKPIRQLLNDAINYERFQNEDGVVIKTIDEVISLALERLLKAK